MDKWYDAEDFTPCITAEVELSDGKRLVARYAMGSWETTDGQAVYPVRFRSPVVVVNVGLYSPPFEIE